jgi:glyoxylase-like metal-dependent hydrolase (beta-lactamase superfamily II)
MILVDTGMDPAGSALDGALAAAGAVWSDVSDVIVTHAHADHVGALDHVRAVAPTARIHTHTLEGIGDAEPLGDGDRVQGLRVLATPGHTAGHLSLLDEDRGTLLVGDCVGVMSGRLVRAPEQFTADSAEAEQSLHRLLALRGTRMLFAHGTEIDEPWEALDLLLRG